MEDEKQTPFNPYKSIWLSPRPTIQFIVDTNPTYLVLVLAALVGVYGGLSSASAEGWGYNLSAFWLFIGIVMIVPFISIIGLYLGAALTRWTGKWLGGSATQQQIRAAYAWSYIPMIAAMVLYIPLLMIYGFDLFAFSGNVILPEADPMVPRQVGPLIIFVAIVETVLCVWSFIVSLHCLGQVQGFSAWRALGNQILASLVLIIPLALILAALVAIFVSHAY